MIQTMTGNLQPLDQKFPIVTPDGRPTLYFIKWAQQKQIDIGAGITAEQALQIIELYLADHQLQAGSGISISPSGNLSDTPTIATEVQAILDQITNVHGSVLFRGAAGWEALAPGSAGQFLKTNGPAADPTWAAGGGGGGGGSTPVVRASSIQSSSAGSFTVFWPTGTVAGDLVIVFTGGGYTAALPAGWTYLNDNFIAGFNGTVFAKVMTPADISAGSVTLVFNGTFNAVISLVTIMGSTVSGWRAGSRFIASSSGAASREVSNAYVRNSDLCLIFAANREASNNTVTGITPTVLQSINATDASGTIVTTTGTGAAGAPAIGNFSVAGSGYYLANIALFGP